MSTPRDDHAVRPGPARTRLVPTLVALALLLATGVASFGPVFAGRTGYLAAGAGVLIGGAAATVGAVRRWGPFSVATVVLVGYLAVGGLVTLPDTLVAGVLPSVETLQRLVFLSFQSWRDLLTVSPPANAFSGPAAVPFLSGLLASSLAVSAALRLTRWAPVAVLPALGLLVVGILWGTRQAPLAVVLGGTFAAVALAWASWQQSSLRRDDSAEILHRPPMAQARARRATVAAGLLVVATLAGVGARTLVPETDRYVLRDDVVPPLDLRDYASPLTTFRFLERDARDETLFTVTGLPAGARLRLAALTAYDGNVFRVAGSSAGYRRVGTTIAPSGATDAEVTRVSITVDTLSGVWLPGGGDLRGVRFTGADASLLAGGLYYNPDTGNALTTAGLEQGAAYDVDVAFPVLPSEDELAGAAVGSGPLPEDTGVPDVVSTTATDYAGSAGAAYAQLTALSEKLRGNGFFSDGSDGSSRAGHTTERITTFLGGPQLVGDDEQYAVAMTLMARHLGLPARVVMGFYPGDAPRDGAEPLAITGADAHVWVEVDFGELGWVPFDATPDRDKTPDTKAPRPEDEPQPEVLPPPDPPREPPAPPLDSADDDLDADRDAGPPLLVIVVVWVLGGSLVLLLVAMPFLLVAGLKRRRRRRRLAAERAADRVSGAWEEVVDHAVDAGFARSAAATRQETAGSLTRAYPATGSVALAERVDRGVFGEGDPTAEEVAAVWDEVSRIRAEIARTQTRRGRLRTRYSTRSLRGPDGLPALARLRRLPRRRGAESGDRPRGGPR